MTAVYVGYDQGLESFVETVREKAPSARVTVGASPLLVNVKLGGMECDVHLDFLSDSHSGQLCAEEIIRRWPNA